MGALSKICTVCRTEKPATPEFFHAYARSPDGRRSVCRACRAAQHQANRDAAAAKKKQHYQQNRERIIADVKAYYVENGEAMRAAGRRRHHRNREIRLEQNARYRKENREAILAKQRERNAKEYRERYGVDLEYTLTHRIRALLRVSLAKRRPGKRMRDILGYGVPELRAHLESKFADGMTWDHFLNGKIHIDHKRPIASFNFESVDCEQFKECWALSNLQPLWAFDNLSKGAKLHD